MSNKNPPESNPGGLIKQNIFYSYSVKVIKEYSLEVARLSSSSAE